MRAAATLLSLLVFATSAHCAQAHWLERIAARYRGIKSLSASYERISRLMPSGPGGMGELVASGRLLWARPFKLRMQQLKPTRELVVSNGKVVWWVRPARAEVQVYSIRHFTEGLTSLLGALGGLEKLREDYIVQELSATARQVKLVLKPRHPRLELAGLTCWFSARTLAIEGLRITTMLGETTTYRLWNVRLNPPVDPQEFTCTPPPGYRVIDHRPLKENPAPRK